MPASKQAQSTASYGTLLTNRSFSAFLATQFLGTFNDNLYKMMVSLLAVQMAASQSAGSAYLVIAGAIFVAPFLLFAGPAGQLADRFSKTRVLQITKACEIAIMIAGLAALLLHRVELLLAVLFLLAAQATFFSPAKYGILPEMLSEAQLMRANGLVELTTFGAIVLGTSFGAFLIALWKHQPWLMGGTLLVIALFGSLMSLRIQKVPAPALPEPFRWNPFTDVIIGLRRLRADRDLALSVIGMSYFWFIGALVQMSILLVGSEKLHANEVQLGLLITALALGIGLGSLAAGAFSHDGIELGIVPIGALLLGGSSIALYSAHSYHAFAIWLFAMAFGGGLFIVPLNALLQQRAGKREKGRLQATNSFVNMSAVILASGVLWTLHDYFHWQAVSVIAAAGVLTVAASLLIGCSLPVSVLRLALTCAIHALFRIRFEGRENIPPEGGALLIANHVTYVDAVLVGACTGRSIRFLMLQSLYDNRLLNPFCRLLRVIPIPPGAHRSSVAALREAREEVHQGNLACIFPEGGLTETGQVEPFHRGVERIVTQSPETPVIPIYLDGLWGSPFSKKRGGEFRSWARPWRRAVTIYVGPAMYGPHKAADLRDRILELGAAAVQLRQQADDTLAHRFVRAARRNWSSPALADSANKQLTFGQIATAAVLLSDWLNREHAAESTIGMLLPSSVAGALANYGVTLAGRTAVNINFVAGEQHLRFAQSHCNIKTILTSRKFVEKLGFAKSPEMVFIEDILQSFTTAAKYKASLRARLTPARLLAKQNKADQIAAILFSSGSTGTPKGICLTHFNLLSNIDAVAQVYPVGQSDCMLGALPFFHSFGYAYTLWFPFLQSFRAVYHANPTDAKTIGELTATHEATFLLSTPTFLNQYLRKCARQEFASLRYVLVGAEKLSTRLAAAFEEKFGVMPLEGYGCTEMSPVIAVNTPDPRGQRPGSVGRPVPGVSIRVVDPETRTAVTSGEQGLLLVKGPNRMAGYYNNDEATANALQDSYYVTGDIGRLDKDGFLFITDRLARFSKIGGEMVPHLRIEEALSALLGGASCFVTGVSDERRGEKLAVLYTGPSQQPAKLASQLAASGLPALWVPKPALFFRVQQIPMLASGKVHIAEARDMVMKSIMANETPEPAHQPADAA